jgi:tRNA A-37 threonylcarbamoyl transferase component Bud32
MNADRACPECGRAMPVDAPEGLCPDCLLRAGLARDESTAETVRTPPFTGGLLPQPTGNDPRTIRYFGDYELLEEVARGGMGVVWKARQTSLNRTVAVKMILSGQLAAEVDIKRFRTEAEAAAQLKHPNIVAIHEVGEHEGRHYYSMDYVDGRNLAALTASGPLPAAKAAQYVKAIAEAVQYAHQRGILHRDLKPQNVLLDERGQPQVTDFGLARQLSQESSLTVSGSIVGSPSYMPPEQASGRQDRVGPHSDVYSLGAILYELLTGRPPFRAESAVDTLRKVVEEEPVPPGRLNPRVNRDLETICLKCLEKDPARRYATARDLAEDLGRFLNLEPILACRASLVRRLSSWLVRHPWVITGAVSVAVLLTAGLAYRMWERVDALEWHRLNPEAEPPFDAAYFLPDSFLIVVFIEFFFLQGIPVSWFLALRAQRSRGVRFYQVFGVIAAVQLLFGLEIFRRVVAAGAWEPDAWFRPVMASLAALTNVWFGSGLLWKTLRDIRLHLPGLAGQPVAVENPLRYTNTKGVLKVMAWEALGGGILVVIAAFIERHDEGDMYGGMLIGALGMCGVTALVLISHLVAHSRGLERQARLPMLPVIMTLVAVGLLGLLSSSWPAIIGLYVLGFVIGKVLIRRHPLQRGGVPLPEALARTSVLRLLVREFWQLVWRKRMIPIAAAGLALAALVYAFENWRGRRAWEQTKARLIARGEMVEWPDFLPQTRVPDEQNAFKHPFVLEHMLGHPSRDWKPRSDLNWFDHGFLGHGLAPGPPVPLDTLRKLPKVRTEPATLLALDPTLADAEPVSVSFNQASLSNAVVSLAGLAGLAVAWGEEAAGAFIRKPYWDAASQQTRSDQPTLVTFASTSEPPVTALDALLKEHHLMPVRSAQGGYLLDPVRTSLEELLERLSRDEAQLERLLEAIRRPHAQMDWTPDTPLLELFPCNWVAVRSAAWGQVTRSKIHLLQGNPQAALRDLETIGILGRFAARSDTLTGTMMNVALEGLRAEEIEETLEAGLWPHSHLAALQEVCTPPDLLAPWKRTMQSERALATEAVLSLGTRRMPAADFLRMFRMGTILADGSMDDVTRGSSLLEGAVAVAPKGWRYQNMVHVAWTFDFTLALEPERRTINASMVDRYEKAVESSLNNAGASPYTVIARIAAPNNTRTLHSTARSQVHADLAFVACVLERHRAARGAYPESLAELVPEFAEKLPHDLFDGQPLRYRPTRDGSYILYSIGWNARDDFGAMAQPRLGEPRAYWSNETGDWVWQGVPRRP